MKIPLHTIFKELGLDFSEIPESDIDTVKKELERMAETERRIESEKGKTRYFKMDNKALKYNNKGGEFKVDGVVKDVPGEQFLNVIRNGEQITKEEYNVI